MNKELKYPSGKVNTTPTPVIKKTSNSKKSRLGTDFETMINNSNTYYLNSSIACIYKKPTPVQVVSVSYPARTKAKITEAYYKIPSTTDYNGIYLKLYIDFEAKSCHSTSFPFSHIFKHQIEHLKLVNDFGGVSFLLIEFSLKHEIYLLPIEHLFEKYSDSLNGGRKSIPYTYFKEHGILIKRGYAPEVDYLRAVDCYLSNKNHSK